ncbi:pilus assembly protein PilW [Veronia nyctiphanis]|uniref:Pilus assembly protein PilW n=1 Tax=Veronia nyctiphanis TaxID=1278244 RepID=A0A4Q0YT39_9GAMM|nr:prepilin-type N-terminal cleavage/methylation domain-containing protein [Veronia nyctiphanis]RXJ73853.1 pilus assembly protein PilW [Veronia nyctiphanis]
MNKNKGYSLVELLVGSAVSLIVIAASIAALSSSMSLGNDQLQRDYLTSQLNVIATAMSQEISRAGYCFDCLSSNPFITADPEGNKSSVIIDDLGITDKDYKGSCIRFAYNHDSRSGSTSPHKDDLKGYRLDGDKQVIEIYENRDGSANWKCDRDNGGTYWQDMNYERLDITELTFKRNALTLDGVSNRVQQLEITITAAVSDKPGIKESLTFNVTVWNVDS